ncbi:unnamed protein product [Nezara viridula]|uniref:Uncharacterized protein n=1 Tax=Nezara viridula TaxID=85310 RepID=A0A9P0MQF6_NEZVI|nr:unnamed protein product [Nezara viridula]
MMMRVPWRTRPNRGQVPRRSEECGDTAEPVRGCTTCGTSLLPSSYLGIIGITSSGGGSITKMVPYGGPVCSRRLVSIDPTNPYHSSTLLHAYSNGSLLPLILSNL